jgi:hypothetical protein
VKYWEGTFSIGATYLWGQSFSDILDDTETFNNFVKLAEGGKPGDGGTGGNSSGNTTYGNACVQTNSPSVKNIGIGGGANSVCYSKAIMSNSQWKNFENDMFSAGIQTDNSVNISSPSVTHVCLGSSAGGSGLDISDYSGNTENFGVNTCSSSVANIGGMGGFGGAGYSPVFGIDSGRSETNTNVDTTFHQATIQLNFAMKFGEIERFCGVPQDEVCF